MQHCVEIEFAGDRLASSRVAHAYALLAPEQRRRMGVGQPPREELSDERDREPRAAAAGGGDLRAGVLRASAPSRDDPQPARGAALNRPVHTTDTTTTVDLNIRTYHPVLIPAGLADQTTPIPWLNSRELRRRFPPRQDLSESS